jgi:DNA polymerase-1
MEVEIEDAGIGRVYREMELPLIEIIRGMEDTGILLDTTVLGKLSKTLHTEIEVLEKAIYRAAGEEFNINSPKQLAHILFETLGVSRKGIKKTAGGAVSTRESELQKLATEHDIVGHILNYRELQKLVSTYVDTLPKLVAKDGRVHSQLHQTGTATGRMSSTDPNMQNLPAGSGWGSAIRAAFITPPNATFLAFDYSQIEMRVLAELSGDKKLIKIFSSGQDVHSQVAAFVYGVPESDVTKDMRRRAKVVNFGIIYGMGVNALKDNLGTTRKEAEEFYASYFDAFPTIRAYFDTVVAEAHRLGYTTTLFGRRRYLPGLRSHIPYIRAAQERMALNAPIQGTAADLIKLAMVRVHEALVAQGLEDGVRMILQIHDELVFEAKDELLEETLPHIRDAMESVGDMKVPLVVNASKGPNLGELKDIT